MLIFIVFFNFIFVITKICMHENAAEILMPIHSACLAHLTGTEHRELYQAMVCGSKVHNLSISEPLKALGLYTILSSSGSHLLFFEHCIRSIIWRIEENSQRNYRIFFWPMAILFATINLFNAIVVRATLLLLLRDCNRALKLNWTETQLITTAGLCSMPFCRGPTQVSGLLVGWSASLALAAFGRKRGVGRLNRQLRLYLLLVPVLIPFSVPHPLAIIAQLLLVPAVGIALMGASLTLVVTPRAGPIVDAAVTVAKKALLLISANFPEGLTPLHLPLGVLAAYVGALTLWTWNLERSATCDSSLS